MLSEALNVQSGFGHASKRRCRPDRRQGTIMLFCIMVNALLAVMAIGILNTLSIQASTAAAIESKEKAEYLAEAGVQRALEIIERNPAWTGTLKWNDTETGLSHDTDTRQYKVGVTKDAKGTTHLSSQGVFRKARATRVITLGATR